MAKKSPAKKSAAAKKSRDFFTVPAQSRAQSAENAPTIDFSMRLGGVPLETRAGFELLSHRLRQLLTAEPTVWQEIEREESGSFFTLFRKYHLPLLVPFFFFFCVHELLVYVNLARFIKHIVIYLPAFVALYAGYIFLIGIVAEETAENAGGRFSPQAGMRVALFSSMIVSFFSVALFLPLVGTPLMLLAFFLHMRQLGVGARSVLNLSGSSYRIYRLGHVLVWIFMGLSAFAILSVASLILSKLGLGAI